MSEFIDISGALPITFLGIGILLLLLLDLFKAKSGGLLDIGFLRIFLPVAICIGTWFYSMPFAGASGVARGTLLYTDTFTFLFTTVILVGTCLTLLLSHDHLQPQKVRPTVDIDILMLLASLGGIVMASAANLIVIFVGFELLSVCVYALTGAARQERASSEGALKYFLLGAFSSAFLLYGMTLTYGATGSMALADIALNADGSNPMLLVGLSLMVFGFAFKVSLVPFHFWAPDAYQGAPVTIASYMAVVVKTAAIACFLRVLTIGLGPVDAIWSYAIWILAALTMTVGNLAALRQQSVKRMLAYSSIAHAGYAMLGFLAAPGVALEATAFYMLAYACMTVASFGVVLLITKGSNAQYERDDISSFAQVGWSHPFLGIVMTIALLSLAGIPPLAGFVGKFYLFSAALGAGYVGLVIIAALNSVVSLYYYLRVIVVMYFSNTRVVEWMPSSSYSLASRLALIIATVGTASLGLFASNAFSVARVSAESLW